MKFKFILIFLFIISCSQNYNRLEIKKSYSAKGFALIYNDADFENKIIKTKLNNSLFEISHNKLRLGTLIKIINPKTNDEIILKNKKKSKHLDFYKILITEPVASKINLEVDAPLVEIFEIKKNKSFVAKKTKIFKEEEKIHSNAPVENVKIDNISKNLKEKKIIKDKFNIIIGEFYSKASAISLKKRITNELEGFNNKNLFIQTRKTNKTTLLSGPYTSINLLRNDYILLKNYGFEELDINTDE